MKCRDCPRFCQGDEDGPGRCLDGKLNPQTYSMAVEVSETMGLRAICIFNDHRERLVAQRGLSRPPGNLGKR